MNSAGLVIREAVSKRGWSVWDTTQKDMGRDAALVASFVLLTDAELFLSARAALEKKQ